MKGHWCSRANTTCQESSCGSGCWLMNRDVPFQFVAEAQDSPRAIYLSENCVFPGSRTLKTAAQPPQAG
ncbi:MAG: hypothetical protein HY671_01095 [Chloroflexi bacterium]|nr:hypothetical protein [Chloroflexota bacterium]